MNSSLIGIWSHDAALLGENDKDTRLFFEEGGSGKIVSGKEEIPISWESPDPEQLVFAVSGHRYGPFKISIRERDFPRGRFMSLEAQHPILPFGMRIFAKIK